MHQHRANFVLNVMAAMLRVSSDSHTTMDEETQQGTAAREPQGDRPDTLGNKLLTALAKEVCYPNACRVHQTLAMKLLVHA